MLPSTPFRPHLLFAAMAVLHGCAPSGGYCGGAANANQPVCRMSEAQQAAIPVKTEWWRPNLTVTLYPLETAAQRDGLRRAAGGHGGMALSGLAVPDLDSGRCDLFVALPPRPEARDYETVGHELMHCFAGGYHPDMLSGRAASSYLSPRQAAAQREGLAAAVAEAEARSGWTVSCTFGLGGCPRPAAPPSRPLNVTFRPSSPEQLARIGRAIGQEVSENGISLAEPATRSCDLYLPRPATYLGRGMEAMGRRMLACLTDRGTGGDGAARLRKAAEAAWSEGN
jgi:hypothetical protein